MPRSTVLLLLLGAVACEDTPAPAPSAPSATAAPTAIATASSSSSLEAPEVCKPGDVWTPKPAKADFTWSQEPRLDAAPKDGAVASVGGEPFQIEKVEVWVDGKKGEWELRTQAGPLGPALMFKGKPAAGQVVEEKWAQNRGYFQVPKKGLEAQCFAQTTSHNGKNARIVKLTKLDEAAQLADGVFVTTWEEGFDDKRKLWAAGTFTGAKLVVR
jgi:hypothetical protein